MNRRIFLKRATEGLLLTASLPLLSCRGKDKLRFGIITDIHYSLRDSTNVRFYRDSMEKLRAAIEEFNRSRLDFLIELGDFKDQDVQPRKENTLNYLDAIEETFRTFNGPRYHVLGNHDMDSISKDDFLGHTSNHGKADKKAFYSFTANHIKCIVLDANNNEDGTPYDSGRFDWTKAYVPDEQLDWLAKELAESDKPVIIFIHQLLDSFSGLYDDIYVKNAGKVRPILESSGNVLAVFQGHHHPGHYSFRNNIHYWTMKGMIEGPFPANNSFAIIEIDEKQDIYIDGFMNCEDRTLKRT